MEFKFVFDENSPCYDKMNDDEHRSLKFRYDVCGSNRSGYEIIVRYS